jgi:nucleotide-binding universal stress UspA family protein
MSYATLMLFVDADGAAEQQVRLAAKLADKFNATLIGLSALALQPPLIAEGVVIQEVTEAEIKEAETKLADRGKWFRSLCGAEHRKIEWRSSVDFPTDVVAREARSADLVVIGLRKRRGDIYSSLDPDGVILKLGRPALVVPEGVASLRADHILIGWKDTREARRAVRDALPFLHQAGRVTIAQICRPGEEDTARRSVSDVGNYLARHRINGGIEVILHEEGAAATQLVAVAQNAGADLIVTGAYGHSRLGEWILGGMTRDLLTSSPICCLMSH